MSIERDSQSEPERLNFTDVLECLDSERNNLISYLETFKEADYSEFSTDATRCAVRMSEHYQDGVSIILADTLYSIPERYEALRTFQVGQDNETVNSINHLVGFELTQPAAINPITDDAASLHSMLDEEDIDIDGQIDHDREIFKTLLANNVNVYANFIEENRKSEALAKVDRTRKLKDKLVESCLQAGSIAIGVALGITLSKKIND